MTDPLIVAAVLSTGFILGLKHALDADHVVAVSTLVSGSDSTKVIFKTGALWGLGHTVALMVVCLIVVPLNIPIYGAVEAFLEGVVGVMLVLLGIRVLGFWPQKPRTPQQTGYRSMFVGAVHGLAGSAALTIIVLTTVDSLVVGLLYVVIFGFGSMLGMLLFSGILSIPLRMLGKKAEAMAGVVSIIMGLVIVLSSLP